MARGVLDLGILQGRLEELARQDDPGATIVDLERIEKGLSTLTFSAVLRTSAGRAGPMVVKVAPPGLVPKANRDVLRQARIYRGLSPHGVPVPEVLLWGEQTPDAPPLFAMTRIEGDTIDPTWPADPSLPDDVVRARGIAMAAELGRLHRVPVAAFGDEAPVDLVGEIERWTAAYRTVDPGLQEVAAGVRARLLQTLPEALKSVINHGDYRYGNVIFEGTTITGLIDWEIAAVQDPRFDLANLIVYCGVASPLRLRKGVYAHSEAELTEAYEQTFGAEIQRLDWFVLSLRYKCAAALALLVKRNARLPEPDALMVEVGEGLVDFLRAGLSEDPNL